MLDSFLARYGHQDIHKLRGVEFLTLAEKAIFHSCLLIHIEHEVQPLPGSIIP